MASFQLTQIDNGEEAYIITGSPDLDSVKGRSRSIRIPEHVTVHHDAPYDHDKSDTLRIRGTLDIQK